MLVPGERAGAANVRHFFHMPWQEGMPKNASPPRRGRAGPRKIRANRPLCEELAEELDGAKQSLQAWERWWDQQRNQLVPSRRVEELERWASQTEKVNDNVVAKYNQKCEKYEALFTKLETLKEEKSDMLRMAKEAEAEIHGLRL